MALFHILQAIFLLIIQDIYTRISKIGVLF